MCEVMPEIPMPFQVNSYREFKRLLLQEFLLHEIAYDGTHKLLHEILQFCIKYLPHVEHEVLCVILHTNHIKPYLISSDNLHMIFHMIEVKCESHRKWEIAACTYNLEGVENI